MKYQEIKPEGFLSNFIKCFWEYQNTENDIAHTILPDGYFDLIVKIEGDSVKNIMLTGVWTKPVNVVIKKETKLFAIRFKLISAEYIFKQEIKSIIDNAVFLPENFWDLNTFSFDSFEQAVYKLSSRISLSLKHLKEIDERKIKLFELIYQSKISNVQQLSGKIFWSSRQINRYFNKQYGFPLKTFLSIVRCRSRFADIAKGEYFTAEEYFDQAHFIREVKKYTGATPGELSKNENDRFLQLTTILG